MSEDTETWKAFGLGLSLESLDLERKTAKLYVK